MKINIYTEHKRGQKWLRFQITKNNKTYTCAYTSIDYGTERVLNIYHRGNLIKQIDPFWPCGCPVSKHEYIKHLVQTTYNVL